MKTDSPTPLLQTQGLGMTFVNENGGLQVLSQVTFSVHRQEFVCVVGPSGCGKTTLLRLLAGLLTPTEGRVLFEGEPLLHPRRRFGFLFQQANLMPWRTVQANVSLPLELAGMAAEARLGRAQDLIHLVGLDGFEQALPRDLSGGMAQRVAIARALAHQPDVLLLDEPFGALDALTRERMALELLRIWEARTVTVMLVTHSISEAVMLSDRVFVISRRPGRLVLDLPVGLERPRELSVAHTPAFGKLAAKVRAAIEVAS
ncbi:MAG: ABC transporter ATP-binding protein [Anaerolineales bacterium]|nr:ABC transporter ATP-binding protein [Anaerolineales bacterium]